MTGKLEVGYSLTNLPQTIETWQLDDIECELRGVQAFEGAQAAKWWWERNFAHKYPLYRYDTIKERVVRRDESGLQGGYLSIS